MKTILEEVKEAQPKWFSEENRRFFGDKRYWVMRDQSGKPYLVRSTGQWSDMFDQPEKLRYRLNSIDPETLKIEHLIDDEFQTLKDVKEWLKGGRK